MTAAKRQAHEARMEELYAVARAIVATGHCPTCNAPLARNSALEGWWQCSQYGAPQFRVDPELPSCSFQTFTS